MDHDSFKNDVMSMIGKCWSLETLDLAGALNLDDLAFQVAQKANEFNKQQVGLKKLVTLKLANCSKMTEATICNYLVKMAPNIEHLELNRLTINDHGLKTVVKEFTKLRFVDFNGIKDVNYQLLDEFKKERPDLLIRQWRMKKYDKKDNELRVPWRVVEKKKKKGKKGGKKKK
jgi:hypothetical protein